MPPRRRPPRLREPDPEPVEETTTDDAPRYRWDVRIAGHVEAAHPEVWKLGPATIDTWMRERGYPVNEDVDPPPLPWHIYQS